MFTRSFKLYTGIFQNLVTRDLFFCFRSGRRDSSESQLMLVPPARVTIPTIVSVEYFLIFSRY